MNTAIASAEWSTIHSLRIWKQATLWKISAQHFGNGSRYKEIVSLNGLKSNVIYSGMKL